MSSLPSPPPTPRHIPSLFISRILQTPATSTSTPSTSIQKNKTTKKSRRGTMAYPRIHRTSSNASATHGRGG
ncbi:hypothetical protein BDY24DRAFT_416450 [Mrakia frigida]|uniref:uncharacterized protein n=1 Tax=Mrakia frigida TaxID=29902 RepID=UPI003FCC2586